MYEDFPIDNEIQRDRNRTGRCQKSEKSSATLFLDIFTDDKEAIEEEYDSEESDNTPSEVEDTGVI